MARPQPPPAAGLTAGVFVGTGAAWPSGPRRCRAAAVRAAVGGHHPAAAP
jgi:hypothetical protein